MLVREKWQRGTQRRGEKSRQTGGVAERGKRGTDREHRLTGKEKRREKGMETGRREGRYAGNLGEKEGTQTG